MNVGNVFFALCSLVAVTGAVMTVASRNPIRGAIGLLATILGITGLFLELRAQFLAAIQLIVYAGAVVVLFVFVIMMIGPAVPDPPATRGLVIKTMAAALMAGVSLAFTAVVATLAPVRALISSCAPEQAECSQFGGVAAFSHDLFVGDVLPFELISVLLTVAIIGAIAVARGHTADEIEAAMRARAQRKVLEEQKRARERELAAEVAASGGH
jgi:NADH-quinone oxidoreductase subunit J